MDPDDLDSKEQALISRSWFPSSPSSALCLEVMRSRAERVVFEVIRLSIYESRNPANLETWSARVESRQVVDRDYLEY